MPLPVYFDTSVFLEIFVKNSLNAGNIKNLLVELRGEKVRIYTSILTIQEASVLTYRRGKVAHDNSSEISKIARICGIDKDIALTAAKREAEIRDLFGERPDESEMKQRRRWDCIHIATAQVMGCSRMYSTDPHMFTRKNQLKLSDIEMLQPVPSAQTLPFGKPPAQELVNPPDSR